MGEEFDNPVMTLGRLPILVSGALNVDEVFHVPHIVRPGETLSSTRSRAQLGGKATNTAVAAALARAEPSIGDCGPVYLAAQYGKDVPSEYLAFLRRSHVSTQYLAVAASGVPTGRAVVQVTGGDAQNAILLEAGANLSHGLEPVGRIVDQVMAEQLPSHGDATHLIMMTQNETPEVAAILRMVKQRYGSRVLTVLNPSPFDGSLPWDCVDILIMNESEAYAFTCAPVTDSKSPLKRQHILDQVWARLSRTRKAAIITCGEGGASALCHDQQNPGKPMRLNVTDVPHFVPIDTTGAGDCFAGTLLGCLRDFSQDGWAEALDAAVARASASVTRTGAAESFV